MSPSQAFEFDLNGFIVVDQAIPDDVRQAILEDWEARLLQWEQFDISFSWGYPWTYLIDNPTIRGIMTTCVGRGYRLDHAFAVTEKFYSTKGRLHHRAAMVDQGVIYSCQQHRPFTSVLTVSYSLLPLRKLCGGFCCIPGSHKANFPTPDHLFEIENNHLCKQIPQKAGSALVFTEALSHGTYPYGHETPRRTVILRYTPGGMQFREAEEASDSPIRRLPRTRLGATPIGITEHESELKPHLFTERERDIVLRKPYFLSKTGSFRENR